MFYMSWCTVKIMHNLLWPKHRLRKKNLRRLFWLCSQSINQRYNLNYYTWILQGTNSWGIRVILYWYSVHCSTSVGRFTVWFSWGNDEHIIPQWDGRKLCFVSDGSLYPMGWEKIMRFSLSLMVACIWLIFSTEKLKN